MDGRIKAFKPEIVKNPVVQTPKSVTSPLQKEGSIPKITENKYISIIPIMNVGSETPARETTRIVFEIKLSL